MVDAAKYRTISFSWKRGFAYIDEMIAGKKGKAIFMHL
jgi:hypothetical protein